MTALLTGTEDWLIHPTTTTSAPGGPIRMLRLNRRGTQAKGLRYCSHVEVLCKIKLVFLIIFYKQHGFWLVSPPPSRPLITDHRQYFLFPVSWCFSNSTSRIQMERREKLLLRCANKLTIIRENQNKPNILMLLSRHVGN